LELRGRKWQEAGEDCIMRSFMTCTLHQGDQIKDDEMDGACRMCGRYDKYTIFSDEGRRPLRNLGVNARTVLKLL